VSQGGRPDRDVLDAVHRAVSDALGDPNWSAPSGLTAVTIRTRPPPGDRPRPRLRPAAGGCTSRPAGPDGPLRS
jgi:hypothetical protein